MPGDFTYLSAYWNLEPELEWYRLAHNILPEKDCGCMYLAGT